MPAQGNRGHVVGVREIAESASGSAERTLGDAFPTLLEGGELAGSARGNAESVNVVFWKRASDTVTQIVQLC